MSILVGALLGFGLALGLLVAACSAPPMRTMKLVDRIAPYLSDHAAPSRLLDRNAVASLPIDLARRLIGPSAQHALNRLDRLVGGSDSVRRRLAGLGSRGSVEEFRIEQLISGAVGLIGGALALLTVTALRGAPDPLLVVGGALVGGAGGMLGRDWLLTRQLRRREQAMVAEFPVVTDLLALAVVAGESPIDALQRVCRLTKGELTRDLQQVLDEARTGTSITTALTDLGQRTTLEPFARFLNGLVVALERGTPLAGVLHAQAADVRESAKRALLEAGGQKELQMMVPVKFAR
jgi:tight adherence protein C